MKRITLKDIGIKKLFFDVPKAEFELDFEKEIGEGGTCLVYHAYKISYNAGEKTKHRVILKEFYPVLENTGEKIDRNADGSLLIPKSVADSVQFQRKLDRFKSSYKLFVHLHNEEDTNNIIIDADERFEANGTWYLVADYNAACSLAEYMDQKPELYDFSVVLKNTAEAVSTLHQKGYLHLDLSPSNIMVFKNGSVRLMDSDSFLEKETVLEECPSLSWSEGYAAPELRDNEMVYEDLYWIGERYDVYSLGAIFFRYLFDEPLIITTEAGDIDRRKVKSLLSEFLYENELEKKINEKYERKSRAGVYRCSKHTVRIIQDFLWRSLSGNIGYRYPNMDYVIKAINEFLPFVDPKEIRIYENFQGNKDEVFGVERKLMELEDAFGRQGEKGKSRIVMINGIGGIGKSTFAREYAHKHQKMYQTIVEVSADNAKAVLSQIPVLNFQSEFFQERLDLLRVLFEKQISLLIVHDYNLQEDEFFDLFGEIPCDIILTGWSDWAGADVEMVYMKKGDLTEGAAVRIFCNAYLQDARSKNDEARVKTLKEILETESETVMELVRRLDLHPLTMKLMGRQMAYALGRPQTPKDALEEIEQYGIRSDKRSSFQNNKDGNSQKGNVYQHLQSIYKVALDNRRLPEDELEVLRYMILLSSGVSVERFMEWTGLWKDIPEILTELTKKGWISYDSEGIDHLQKALKGKAYDGVFEMPMAIAEVLYRQKELISTVDNSKTLMDMFFGIKAERLYSYPAAKMLVDLAENLYRRILEAESEEYATMLHRCGHAFNHLKESAQKRRSVIECWEKELQLQMRIHGKNSSEASLGFRNLAAIYRTDQGTYDKGYAYYKEALDIRIGLKESDSMAVASIYDAMGTLCQDMGEYQKALAFYDEALKIKQISAEATPLVLGQSYHNIGVVHKNEHKIEKAVFHLKQALHYYQQAGSSIYIAFVYCDLAHCYMRKKDDEAVFRCYEVARELFEAMLGENSYRTAVAYLGLGIYYEKIEEYPKALFYAEKACKIYKKVSGEKHIDTAVSYFLLGNIYMGMGEEEKGLSYIETAELIKEKYDRTENDFNMTHLELLHKDMEQFSTKLQENARDEVMALIQKEMEELELLESEGRKEEIDGAPYLIEDEEDHSEWLESLKTTIKEELEEDEKKKPGFRNFFHKRKMKK